MRSIGDIRRLTGAVILCLAAAIAPSAVLAQSSPASVALGDSGFVERPCPAPPEALVRYRAMIGQPPPPTAADLEAYRQFVRYLQANDWAYLCRYRDENRLVAQGARPRVVLFGDSITENWKQRDPDLFADGVLDRGVSGQTTPQMVVRFYQDVIALRPRVVHIMAGTNDVAANTGPTSDDEFQNNIKAMADLAQAHGIKVILASIPPAKAFGWRPALRPADKIRALNRWLSAYAQARGLTFVDYYSALADADGGLRPELGVDGVHPSPAGYALMDARFKAALAQAEHR